MKKFSLLAAIALATGCLGGRVGPRASSNPTTRVNVADLLKSSDRNDREEGIALASQNMDAGNRNLLVNTALNDPLDGVARDAAVVLARNGDETLFTKMIQDRSQFDGAANIRRRRLVGFFASYFQTTQCLDVLRVLIRDPDEEVRESAYLALGNFSSSGALSVLLSRKKSEKDTEASKALAEGIRRCKARRSKVRTEQ